MRFKRVPPSIIFLFGCVSLMAAGKRPMQPLDLLSLDRLGPSRVSPNGELLAYTRSILNWEKGERQDDLFVVGVDGTSRRRMTHTSLHSESPFEWVRDSQALLFLSARDGGQKQLYHLPVAGGEARQLTKEKEDVRSFDVSRDGRWIAYLAGASGNRQIHLIDLQRPGQEASRLTKHKTQVESWHWHPDSQRILFTAKVEDSRLEERRKKVGFDVKINDPQPAGHQLWEVAVESGSQQQLLDNENLVLSQLTVSPDGRYLAFVGRTTRRFSTSWDSEIYLFDFDSGASRRISSNSQPEGNMRFSPDGQWLAFTGPDESEQYRATRIFVASTSSEATRTLLGGWKYDGGVAFWGADSQSLFFNTTVGVNRHVFRASLSGGDAQQLTRGDQVITADFDHDAQVLLLRVSTPSEPAETYTAPLDRIQSRDGWRRLTEVGKAAREFQLGAYQTIRWESSDGVEVEGLLVKPVDYQEGRRYPLIVQIHGGPAGTSTNSFPGGYSTYAHVLAGRGYAVFQPNYRGSSGYGEQFRRQIAGDYFRQGFEDIMTGVDFLIQSGVADPEKLGHMGWSAGGHWSNWALTHTDRFKAISSGAGAVNWTSMWAQSDMQINREFYFGGKPYENPDHYREVSPITHIRNARTPTLIMCGAADPRVPNPQSRELYMSLQKLGVPVEYIEFPGMPHSITKPRYQLVKMEAELAWFEKWIHGRKEWLDWKKLLDTLPQDQQEKAGDGGGN